jgi:outer membrane protein assembly factor BamE (lipoprotein component of BamABCDE complex)
MKARLLTLPVLWGLGLLNPAAATAEEAPAASVSTYVATVDPAAFRERPLEHKKLGATVNPATVKMITPGVGKSDIYTWIGAPHFGEGITRRWNYVLFFPAAAGSTDRMRCRMEIRFVRPRGYYNVIVSEVVWQEQSCADRVAAAG